MSDTQIPSSIIPLSSKGIISEAPPPQKARKFTVCVFCGSRPGNSPIFMQAARDLADVFKQQDWSLVYGGGTVGLMGEIARNVYKNGCDVHGIIPEALTRLERDGEAPPQSEYGRTTVVKDMHTRKASMAKEADAFIALPGGLGTAEELFEIVTWSQLGIHNCPVVVLNIDGYYDHLLGWVNNTIENGFLGEDNREIIAEAKSVAEVADKILNYKCPPGKLKLDWGSS